MISRNVAQAAEAVAAAIAMAEEELDDNTVSPSCFESLPSTESSRLLNDDGNDGDPDRNSFSECD
jgi:hypothetical protein